VPEAFGFRSELIMKFILLSLALIPLLLTGCVATGGYYGDYPGYYPGYYDEGPYYYPTYDPYYGLYYDGGYYGHSYRGYYGHSHHHR